MPDALLPTPEDPEAFSYTAVPDKHRGWLRDAAAEARAAAYRTACDMIRVGKLLRDARRRVKRMQFRRWCEAELPWSRAHCYRLIAVADAFGTLLAGQTPEEPLDARIEPTALYLLARPEVPDKVREKAVRLSAARRLTAAEARELLADFRTRNDVPDSKLNRLAPLRPADRVGCRVVPPAAFDPGRAWACLQELVRDVTLVHISTIAEEDGEDDPLYSVTVHREDDYPRNTIRRTLADAVLAAGNREPEKVCPQCGETKPVGLFGLVGTTGDGRNKYCLVCERKRLAAFKAARKAARKAGDS